MMREECECKYLTKFKMKEEWRGQSTAETQPADLSYVCRHPRRRRRVKSPCLPLSDLPCPISLSLNIFPD